MERMDLSAEFRYSEFYGYCVLCGSISMYTLYIHIICYFRGIAATEIRCDSTAYTGSTLSLPSTGSVVVHIGNANITGTEVEFTFRRDPTFSSVTPRMTIPA